jgi:hypothetical protein
MLRMVQSEEDDVEIAVPASVRARAEEIVRLSRRLGHRGAGFTSSREVLAPALIFGLAHMQERYSQAVIQRQLRLGDTSGRAALSDVGRDRGP